MQYGRTALHEAAEGGHKDVIKLLLINGADKDATDRVSLFVYDFDCTLMKCIYICTKQVVVYCHHIVVLHS